MALSGRQKSAMLIAGVVIIDRITKMYIRADVSPLDVIPVIPGFFNIVHTENPGAAFGMLAAFNEHWRGLLLIVVSLIVMAIIGSLLWKNSGNAVLRTGLALVFGGALGNLWDRLVRGTVTDFLQFFFGSYEFPSFNGADTAITIGAGLLLIDLWLNRKETRQVYS